MTPAVTSAAMLDNSPMRLDPIGATGAWTLAPLVGLLAVAYAVVQSAMNASEIVNPTLAAVAICLLAVAGIALTWAAHPRTGRLGRGGAGLIVSTAALAAVLSGLSTWGENRLVQDDWGQMGIALVVFGLVWVRPPGEIVLYGVLGGVVVGVLASEERASLHIVNTPYVYAIVAATPVIAFAAAAATIGAVIMRYSASWMASSERGMRALEPELRMLEQDALRRVQLDELRVTTLPLLASVAERGEITAADIETAAAASAQLREHALEQLRITWVDRLFTEMGIDARAIHDPDRRLPHLPTRERAVLGALLLELLRLGTIDGYGARIRVASAPALDEPERAGFELTAPIAADWRSVRRTAVPFIGVLRSFSEDAAITRSDSTMILRFGFVPA
jgi:hypothetical protein